MKPLDIDSFHQQVKTISDKNLNSMLVRVREAGLDADFMALIIQQEQNKRSKNH